MTNYTIGICFNSDLSKVVLMLKDRPDWQKGKWNFPGGHIEDNEIPEECVTREFKEECNIDSNPKEWQYIGRLTDKLNYDCYIYTIINISSDLKTMETEIVDWCYIKDLPVNCISNVYWLIPFAINCIYKGNTDYIKEGMFLYTNNV